MVLFEQIIGALLLGLLAFVLVKLIVLGGRAKSSGAACRAGVAERYTRLSQKHRNRRISLSSPLRLTPY